MKFSLSWLKQHLGTDADAQTIADTLTAIGLEIEGLENPAEALAPFRVAKVLTAERVPKSKKLVKMWVDLGAEQRTIVAGIAEAYEPESLVGRTIVIVANLKPAKLMGIESNGMVLAASSDDGKPMLLTIDGEAVPGMKVK